MSPQKDHLVDRRKVEAQQCVEPKRTNRAIDFLCPFQHTSVRTSKAGEVGLTSIWCEFSTVHHFDTSILRPVWTPICHLRIFTLSRTIGAHGTGETPVTIPNTEVKPSSGDYTATRWETSTAPSYIKPSVKRRGFYLFNDFIYY